MTTQTYRVTLTDGQQFLMRANLIEASAPITMCWHPDEADDETMWAVTPYQTADARHRERNAARLCAEYAADADDCTAVRSVVEV